MKKTKKLLAAMLSLMMVCALAVPASAVDIIIREPSSGGIHPLAADPVTRTYNAYKLLDLTTSTNDDETVNYAYTVNEKYRGVLQAQVFEDAEGDFWTTNGGSKPGAATSVTDDQILAYLKTLTEDTGTVGETGYAPGTLRDFADDLYAAIVKDGTIQPDKTGNGSFTDMEEGYWMFADVTELGADSETANSLVIVDTSGNDGTINVTPKVDVPTVEKKVNEKNDSTDTEEASGTWQDAADHDIDDNVPFKLTGTLPSNISSYDTYRYVFHDTLSEGLTLNDESIVVKIGEKELTETTHYTVNTDTEDDCTFEIVFEDLLALKKSVSGLEITKDTEIVVEYTAKLNDEAVIGGNGNTNEVYLEFSNNPYDEGTGVTPEDKVTVFTFTLDVDKVKNDQTTPLEGAGFTLYKYDADAQDYVKVGDEIKGTQEDPMTNFVWEGLDSGKYKLVESTVPDGYNKADDIEFQIVATYTTDDNGSNTQTITKLEVKNADGTETISGDGLTFTATASSGTVATKVVNTTGMELPETGGMGTTLFYAVGGALAVGASILLIVKRRMNADEK